MDKTNRKKKSLLINPAFQMTIIGYASAVSAIILFAMYHLNAFAFKHFNEIGELAGLPKDHVYFEFIHMQEATVFRTFVLISLMVAVVLGVGGLFISHRIAGPIYRMRKDLEKMTALNDNELRTIHFRKGDYFPELAETFNRLVESRRKNAKPDAESDAESAPDEAAS